MRPPAPVATTSGLSRTPGRVALARSESAPGSLSKAPRSNGGGGGGGGGGVSSVSGAGEFNRANPLESFFPFDPYLLRASHAFVADIYQEWEPIASTSQDDEQTGGEGGGSEEEEEEESGSSESESDDDSEAEEEEEEEEEEGSGAHPPGHLSRGMLDRLGQAADSASSIYGASSYGAQNSGTTQCGHSFGSQSVMSVDSDRYSDRHSDHHSVLNESYMSDGGPHPSPGPPHGGQHGEPLGDEDNVCAFGDPLEEDEYAKYAGQGASRPRSDSVGDW